MNVLLVGSGDVDLGAVVGPGPYDVSRYERASDREKFADARFDRAVLLGFSDALPRPGMLLRDVADLLAGDGRLVVDVARVARSAVRAALFKGSDGESVGPLVTDEDVVLYGSRSVMSLLEEAGLSVVDANRSGSVVEASRHAGAERAAHRVPEPTDAERLEHARREVAELRAFFTTIHDGQRRLHEEGARMRALLASRERELEAARAELAELRARPTRVAELEERLERERENAERLHAAIADCEARMARMREALAELRER